MKSLHLEADFDFRYVPDDDGDPVNGTIHADGTSVDVFVSAPTAVAGSSSRPLVRQLARGLARQGLQVNLSGPRGTIVSLGAVRSSLLQRVVTRSPHIRLGGWRVLPQLVAVSRGRKKGPQVAAFQPPPTMFPLVPTVTDRRRRRVSTTHDPRGGGRPRLVFSLGPYPRQGDVQRVERLAPRRTTIGSAPECDIVVADLAPVHAVVDRTGDDEYVLTHVAASGSSTISGIAAHESLLRTGARISLDGVSLTYMRDEFADHGRPYGGRQGGELGYQKPQSRPRARGADVGKPRTNRDPGTYFD